jgi:DNA-binding response OmpR family regulator
MVVDDNPSTRRALVESLIEYQPLEVDDGELAIEMMVQNPFDLVVLDVHLVECDAWEILQVFTDQWNGWPEVPMVVVSALDSPEDALRAWTLGAASYLIRPYDPRDLRGVVTRCLQQCAGNYDPDWSL